VADNEARVEMKTEDFSLGQALLTASVTNRTTFDIGVGGLLYKCLYD
jgi:hypothetical protein